MLDKTLLEIIVCPSCKGPLTYEHNSDVERLICETEQLAYSVRDGIPVLLVDQAEAVPLVQQQLRHGIQLQYSGLFVQDNGGHGQLGDRAGVHVSLRGSPIQCGIELDGASQVLGKPAQPLALGVAEARFALTT